jgi:hypothetical protein
MTIRTLVEVQGGRVSIVEDGNETQVTITRGEVQSAARKICNWCPRGTWDNRFHPDGASHVRARDEQEEMAAANVLDRAERAGKVPALERRIRELEADRSGSRGRIEGLEDRIRDLVAERDALLLKVEGYDNDRKTERDRADENRGWAERTEALLENVTTERDALRLQVENAQRELKKYQDSHVCTVECKPNEHTAFQGRKMLTELKGQLVRIQGEVWDSALDQSIENRGRPDTISVGNVGRLADAVSAVRSIVGQP